MLSQVTNIDAGNVPGGLFWTIPIPDGSLKIHVGRGDASFEMDNVPLLDFGNFCNDLVHGPSVPATVSFKTQWSRVLRRVNVQNATEGFAGHFAITNATLEYSASVPGNNFEFVSDPASASMNVFAQIGRERNGIFFSTDGD